MLFVLAGSAQAVVIDWTLGKLTAYLQQANATTPATPFFTEVYAQFESDDPYEFKDVALKRDSPVLNRLLDAMPEGRRWDLSLAFASSAAQQTLMPGGEYMLEAQTATDTLSEVISLRTGELPSTPYFTGSVYSTLFGVNPSNPVLIEWNEPGAEVDRVQLNFDPLAGGAPRVAADVTGSTSMLLPAGSLLPNTTYAISVTFTSEDADPRDGFSSGDGESVLGSLTYFEFTTGEAPEPTALGLAGLAVLAGARRRR